MKFLLDVCVASDVLHKTLNDLGHDVLSARDGYASASDQTLLDLAYRKERVLITEDEDFEGSFFRFDCRILVSCGYTD